MVVDFTILYKCIYLHIPYVELQRVLDDSVRTRNEMLANKSKERFLVRSKLHHDTAHDASSASARLVSSEISIPSIEQGMSHSIKLYP